MPIVADYWTIVGRRPALISGSRTFSAPFYTGGRSEREQDDPYIEILYWEYLERAPGVRAGRATFSVNGRRIGSLAIAPIPLEEFSIESKPEQFHFDEDLLRRSGENRLEISLNRGWIGLQSAVCHFKQPV